MNIFLHELKAYRKSTAPNLLSEVGFEPVFIILSAVIITAFCFVTVICYRKRDLSI